MKQKVIIQVKETLTHKIQLELEEDEVNSLIDDLDGCDCDDKAGDLCSRDTVSEGEWELEHYDIID